MNIYKNKFLSRFGLMHMIATNLCVWLNVLILETSHEILEVHHKAGLHRLEPVLPTPTNSLNHSGVDPLLQEAVAKALTGQCEE